MEVFTAESFAYKFYFTTIKGTYKSNVVFSNPSRTLQ
jgi:hypothetical protein